MCIAKTYELSSSFIHLTESGNIVEVSHLKPSFSSIKFVDEFQERNILGLANEFIIRIEKYGFNLFDEVLVGSSKDEENEKNFYFPSRKRMFQYLHLLLEFAKKLLENEQKLIEVYSFVFLLSLQKFISILALS